MSDLLVKGMFNLDLLRLETNFDGNSVTVVKTVKTQPVLKTVVLAVWSRKRFYQDQTHVSALMFPVSGAYLPR